MPSIQYLECCPLHDWDPEGNLNKWIEITVTMTWDLSEPGLWSGWQIGTSLRPSWIFFILESLFKIEYLIDLCNVFPSTQIATEKNSLRYNLWSHGEKLLCRKECTNSQLKKTLILALLHRMGKHCDYMIIRMIKVESPSLPLHKVCLSKKLVDTVTISTTYWMLTVNKDFWWFKIFDTFTYSSNFMQY